MPVWSQLDPAEREDLLSSDVPFLEWEIRVFPLRAVVCNGATVGDHVRRQLGVSVIREGTLARIKWWQGEAELAGRRVGFAGWNIPLSRPTGLDRNGQGELGKLLAREMAL